MYILEFTNPNFIILNFTNYLCILGIFDNVNNTSKEGPIRKVIVSVKIGQFYELIYNPIMYLNILI